jgi:hypothetical protein
MALLSFRNAHRQYIQGHILVTWRSSILHYSYDILELLNRELATMDLKIESSDSALSVYPLFPVHDFKRYQPLLEVN